jgi:ribosome recycling factor
VPIPALTEERRKEMVKVLHKQAEEGRVAIRHARQEANKELKKQQASHEVSEDDVRHRMDEVQKMTDAYIQKIDDLLKSKEQELMEV